jgi:fumarylacetoacetase
MVAHHTSNGCNLLPGDLLATGTVSGPEEVAAGCLLELTRGGARTVQLPNGESRTALMDGDEVILRGFCRGEGLPQISLGECRGVVLPAV